MILSNEEKTNDYENFEKRMIYMKILKKKGGSRKKGGGGNEIHARCACGQYEFLWTLEINIHLSLKASVNIVFKIHTNSY